MARTFQTDGNPVVARIDVPGTDCGKRQVIPHQAIADYAGRETQVAAYGELLTGQKQLDVSLVFNYFINPERTRQTISGTGANTIDASRLRVAAEGGAGTAEVESKRNIVYRTGHDAFALFTCAFGAGGVGATMKAGPFNGVNGFFISLSETGKLQANHLVGGVLTTYTQGNTDGTGFNLDQLDGSGPSDFTVNPHALLVYRITYGYLGQSPAYFEVQTGAAKGWVPFHTIDIGNTTADLILTDPILPIKFEATSDGTSDAVMFSGSWLGGVIGNQRTRVDNDQFAFDVSKALVAGVQTHIGTMRVKATFQGKVNKIPAEFHVLTAGVDGTKDHILRIWKNTPLTGAVWVDPIGPTSIIEIDLTGTLTGTSPKELRYSTALGKVDSLGPGIEFPIGELRLEVGDTLTFTAYSANASNVVLAGTWEELK